MNQRLLAYILTTAIFGCGDQNHTQLPDAERDAPSLDAPAIRPRATHTMPFAPEGLLHHQVEVQAIAHNGTLGVAFTDAELPGVEGWRCRFTTSTDAGSTWQPLQLFRHEGYQLSGNPTIALATDGTMYVVCMSVSGFDKGVLDISYSKDNGATWAPWTQLIAKTQGIPDRPKMTIDRDGNVRLVYTDIDLLPNEEIHTSIKMVTWQPGMQPRVSTISQPRQDPPAFIWGYQGPSIAQLPNGNFNIPYGDYYSDHYRFANLTPSGEVSAIAALAVERQGTPCTEQAHSRDGQHLVVTDHQGHGISRTKLFLSSDAGQSWHEGSPLAAQGSNLTLRYDREDVLHAVWLDYQNERLRTLYAYSVDHGASFSTPQSLNGQGDVLSQEYVESQEFAYLLGSYHSLAIDTDDTLYAFWLSFADRTKPHIQVTTLK